MKRNVLSLSMTAALVGLGFAGSAQAIVTIPTGTATDLRLSTDGVGHFLYVPYYSVQGGNTTLINLVNTDTTNGKAVKVRFRGASNSDDVFDFQVFLSPGDVWTANVSKNAAGLATLNTTDNSCTKPSKAILNSSPFVTQRLDPTLTGDALANQTREGYVEIFNMADIPPNAAPTSLYTAIKHVNSVPPCSGAAWNALDVDLAGLAAATSAGLAFPTTGLMGDWIILNTVDAGAWSQKATAIAAIDANRQPVAGNLVYFPQTGAAFVGPIANYTADPVLVARPSIAAMYDTPDFSIPYTNTSASPAFQAGLLSAAIATNNIYNEYLTGSGINATTDWVLSMPTRRYSVAMDYTAPAARVYTALPVNYFTASNTAVIGRQVCVAGITSTTFDREENTPLNPTLVIISPNVPGQPAVYCGEANVLSINNGESPSASGLITSPSGTLKATVARSSQDLPNGYNSGWINLGTPGLGAGLPILGYSALRAVGAATLGGTFGATWEHKTNRIQK